MYIKKNASYSVKEKKNKIKKKLFLILIFEIFKGNFLLV